MNNPISLLDKWPSLGESKPPEYAKTHHDWIKALSLEVFNLKVLVSSLDEKNRALEDRIKEQDNEISLLKQSTNDHKEDKGSIITDNSSESSFDYVFNDALSDLNDDKLISLNSKTSEETSRCDHSFGDNNTSNDLTKPKKNIMVLMEWLEQKADNPYPSKNTKELLASQANMTIEKVNMWFRHIRHSRRNQNLGAHSSKKKFSLETTYTLMKFFRDNQQPGPDDIKKLAELTNESVKRIQAWFIRNRRINKRTINDFFK